MTTIRSLRESYRADARKPGEVARAALDRADSNASRNVYITRDEAWTMREVSRLETGPDAIAKHPLWGVPVSLKDCFDLAGFITSSGSRFLAASRPPAQEDSAVAARLRRAGAILTGKTHLHQLAYGITGENRDYGDCLQPGHPALLTGGSSSGAAASVLEGSALAAIGTDTGGSIRVPASLCSLAGYRASISLCDADLWQGGDHLAPSFDTIGWLYRDLGDGPLLGAALFGLDPQPAPDFRKLRIGIPGEAFLHDCDDIALAALRWWISAFTERGVHVGAFDPAIWRESMDLYVPLQASEAAALHPEPRDGFEPVIAERLRWGASIAAAGMENLRMRLTAFRQASEAALGDYDFLLLPCTPLSELRAGEDHSQSRTRILRYTTPISLLGWPAVTLPGRRGGPQLVGKMGSDAALLALTAVLAG